MRYINFEDTGDAISDEVFMKEALKEAHIALEQDEVPIGAVIVSKNRIIGRGHNLTERLNDVTAHAEMQAFTAAANYVGGKYLHDCTLYVTIEPCVMCAGAAYWTQISRIVFGARDEKRGFSVFGSQLLHPKTTVISGILAEESATLITSFFRNKRAQ
ncbi:nucleoside deaminase [Parapedobacter deserti]|uniref:tRNA-specific adenosine deaminase n=1 Tax=Parapedobacter deserti TaxID=1912957 RepID=A0ABV7JEM2_9SPHI